jgi:hypothetical protein
MADVSMETVLTVYKEKYNLLCTENVLLTARTKELEAEVEELKKDKLEPNKK